MKQEEASDESKNPTGHTEEAGAIVSGERDGEGSAQGAEGAVRENVGRARREFSDFLMSLDEPSGK